MRRIAKNERFRYVPVSHRDRLWDLYLTATGRIVHRMPGDPDRGHPSPYYYTWENGRVLPEFAVSYVTHGRGEFESEATGHRVIEAGTVFLLFPSVWHRYRPAAGVGWTNYWACFAGPYAERLVRRNVISPERPILETGLSEQILRPFLTLFDRIDQELAGLQQLAAANILEILGSALAADRAHEEGGRLDAIVHEAKLILAEQVEESVDTKQLARSLGLSYDYFRHVFKEQTGMAPHQYHLQLRINRAKELLNGTDMTTQDIALTLQFEAPYHFCRIFKQKTGMTPTQWRRGTRREEDPRPVGHE
ncbi:MAG: helix-turn-helix transcriptional regulator [Pirellulales bacterium]|nr:helix-turn-helix transcriptional regulator [Pirellulales bacterium]